MNVYKDTVSSVTLARKDICKRGNADANIKRIIAESQLSMIATTIITETVIIIIITKVVITEEEIGIIIRNSTEDQAQSTIIIEGTSEDGPMESITGIPRFRITTGSISIK